MLRDRDLVPNPAKKISRNGIIFALFLGVLTAVAARQIAHAWLFFPLKIQTDQMAPAFPAGSKVYVILIKPKELKQGDVVLVRHPQSPDFQLLRRVIGKVGDQVSIQDGIVQVNNGDLSAPWEQALLKKTPPRKIPAELFPESNIAPQIVKPGHLFLLADDRRGALDSRHLGQFPTELVIGRVWN